MSESKRTRARTSKLSPGEAASAIEAALDNNDHGRAFEVFSGLTKAGINEVAFKVLSRGFHNQSKKQMLEILERNLPHMTAASVEEGERKAKERSLRAALEKAKESQKSHSQGLMGAPIGQDLADEDWRDPHGAGRGAVAKAWQAEVKDKQEALDEFLGKGS